MSLSSEFKKSLKNVEAEEMLDLFIFRPVSYAIVKVVYNTNVTPNTLSVIALLFGIAAGIFYATGIISMAYIGAVCYFLCNTFDCADGQLARLKGNGTKLGRAVDGFVDYIASVVIYVALMFWLGFTQGNWTYAIIISLVAGISTAIQSFYFDYYRNLYLHHVYGYVNDISSELKEFEEEKLNIKKRNGSFIELMLINNYLAYTSLQAKLMKTKFNIVASPEEFRKVNKPILRLWSWNGSTTHIFLLIICTFINKIEWYLILTVTWGNLLLIVTYFIQKNALLKFKK
ncbi:hypothetical protein BH10BAC5_BH10BAC5_21910 [soil metagenome]